MKKEYGKYKPENRDCLTTECWWGRGGKNGARNVGGEESGERDTSRKISLDIA